MTRTVLVLNADYTPLRVIPWQRAVGLLMDDKVSLVEAYTGRMIRSASSSLPHPAVVALNRYSAFRNRVRFNRANVLARDSYTCQYCGVRPRRPSGRPDLGELTIDHIVPRAQADERGRIRIGQGSRPVTCWENVTTACITCNANKADRTPDQANIKLRRPARVPNQLDVLWMALFTVDIPEEWRDFLPDDSPWRAYWTAELED
ncbi:MAG TPA: HNH endonuclease [Deltaproteobacteria bacterium]|nr:HNH endonuclease [Deltaproteobacteria bacterium]